MKIFITGASGYINGSLAEYFRDTGYKVSGLVRSEENASRLRQRGIEPVIGDLSDIAAIKRGTRQSDATINTAEADEVDLVKPLIMALAGTGKALITRVVQALSSTTRAGRLQARLFLKTTHPSSRYRIGSSVSPWITSCERPG